MQAQVHLLSELQWTPSPMRMTAHYALQLMAAQADVQAMVARNSLKCEVSSNSSACNPAVSLAYRCTLLLAGCFAYSPSLSKGQHAFPYSFISQLPLLSSFTSTNSRKVAGLIRTRCSFYKAILHTTTHLFQIVCCWVICIEKDSCRCIAVLSALKVHCVTSSIGTCHSLLILTITAWKNHAKMADKTLD